MKNMLVALCFALLLLPRPSFAAIGCTLSNPAEDLKYLFPEMTSYKEELKNYDTLPEGHKLFTDLKARLGSDLDPVYETFETPYTLYQIYKGDALIGLVHGVNVPGKGGVIQVFLTLDPTTAEIKKFFYQRLESPAAKELRKKEFREQFNGLTLADFYKHEYYQAAEPGSKQDKIAQLRLPGAADRALSEDAKVDYDASIRGVRKNLILMDQFWFNLRFEPFFARAQKALGEAGSKTKGK